MHEVVQTKINTWLMSILDNAYKRDLSDAHCCTSRLEMLGGYTQK